MDLCRRIKLAMEQSASVLDTSALSSTEIPPATKTHSVVQDPKTLVLQACVVADWMTVPLCRIKVVTKLASLVPLPWPKELLNLVNKILNHARQNKLLSVSSQADECVSESDHIKYAAHIPQLSRLDRLASVARVHEIMTRYSLIDMSYVEHGEEDRTEIACQAISCIMYNFANPFSQGATTSKTDDQVLHDSAVIAEELIASDEWASWFARTRMDIVTRMVTDLSVFDDSDPNFEDSLSFIIEQRVSFVLNQLDSLTKYLHDKVLDDSHLKSPSQMSQWLVKHFLGMTCLWSIESILSATPTDQHYQVSLLLELAVAVAQAIIWVDHDKTSRLSPTNRSMDLVRSTRVGSLLHHCDGDFQQALAVINTIGSMRQLSCSSLSTRCRLIKTFTYCWVRANMNRSCAVSENTLLLKNAYRSILPDVSQSNLEELLLWNSSITSVQHLLDCEDVNTADTGLEVSSTSLRQTCACVLQYLQPILQSNFTA
ncbi:unnamed protein product [Echinostoma caproni]|uniref:Uncharacterized protein n=1 Tax=Echinostoma caproni TaxID=27848 RepID=A0A3P8I5A7_9TREM|nr:unnamed protein product [Echinostoma caproni]